MISQRARYAFKAVVARARAKPGVGLQIRELCEQEKLLRKFLEQILLMLKAACYISNRRGHDHEEAFELADRVAILNKGKIEQIGTPAQIVNHPASEFVAEFVGGIDLKRIDIIASSGAARQALKLQVVSSRLAR